MNDQKHAPVTGDDLVNYDEEYETTDVQDDEYEAIPDGRYQVRVDAVELTRTQKGAPMLKWKLRVVGPTHKGRILWRNNVMASPENIRWLKKDLTRCEVRLQRLSELPANLDQLLDIYLEVTKKARGEYESIFFEKRIRAVEGAESPSGNMHETFSRF